MKIDITPTLEAANDFDNTCINARGIEALYVVRTANGVDYSTKFDKQSLEEFQTKRTVSEMLQSWEETINRRHDEAVEAVRSGLHPTRTFERPIMEELGHGLARDTGKVDIVRSKIDTYERNHYKFLVNKLGKQFGAMQFVKIIS